MGHCPQALFVWEEGVESPSDLAVKEYVYHSITGAT